MKSTSTTHLEAQIDELFNRHSQIKSIAEAQEVIRRSLSILPEPEKSNVAAALLHLWLSCYQDFNLKRKIGGIFAVHIGGGEWIPAPKPSRRKPSIDF